MTVKVIGFWVTVIALHGFAFLPNGGSLSEYTRVSAWAAEGDKAQWEEVLAKAKKEGKVTLLGPRSTAARPSLVKAFQKAYPDISLEYQPGSLGRTAPRLRAELRARKTTTMDVVIGGTSAIRNRDVITLLRPKLILPEAINTANWRSTRGQGPRWVDRDRQIALQTSEWVFGYVVVNTDMVKPGTLTSWRDLLKPEWKGKIAFHDPRGSGAGGEVASYLLVKFGDKFIVDLFRDQKVALTRSYSQIADWLAQKKYAIGVAQVPDRIEALKKEGVPLKAFSLKDGPGTLTGGFSVVSFLKGAPHPNATQVFINWVLTKAGQEALHRPLLSPSLRVDVKRDYVPEYTIPQPGLDYLDTYTEEFQSKRRKLAKQVRELVGR